MKIQMIELKDWEAYALILCSLSAGNKAPRDDCIFPGKYLITSFLNIQKSNQMSLSFSLSISCYRLCKQISLKIILITFSFYHSYLGYKVITEATYSMKHCEIRRYSHWNHIPMNFHSYPGKSTSYLLHKSMWL